MNNEKEFYDLISIDSMSWLDNSEKLKISADLIQKELQILIEPFLNEIKDYNNEDKIQAFWNSYFLIIGHAFESLIKGLSIENNRCVKSFDDMFKTYWSKYNSGHGISEIAKDNILDLTDEELKILKKLETYIIWAGRYPLPKKLNMFIDERDRLVYDSNDYNTINNLFDKIKSLLIQEWKKNEYK